MTNNIESDDFDPDTILYPHKPAHLAPRPGVMHVRMRMNEPVSERWWITSPDGADTVEFWRVDRDAELVDTWYPLGVHALADVPKLISSITVDHVRLGAYRRSWCDHGSIAYHAPVEPLS
jgi:hypothetical protein